MFKALNWEKVPRLLLTPSELKKAYGRHVLATRTVAYLLVLIIVTAVALAHLFVTSTDRARDIKQEFFQRDLRDLVGRFDADERFVVENNLSDVLEERRAITPLMLPRQYYVGLPSGSAAVFPRQPPRNCFVSLVAEASPSKPSGDRICPYFADNKQLGRYLFLAMTMQEEQLIPLKTGDTTLSADAVRVSVTANNKTVTWWLTFQLPPNPARKDRFEITAFREIDGSQRDRDKKIEGWAYLQPQAKLQPQAHDKNLLYVIARLDFKEFLDSTAEESWPPPNWRKTTLSLERRDASAPPIQINQIKYASTGIADFSLPALATPVFNAYGLITVKGVVNEEEKVLSVKPPASLNGKADVNFFGFKFTNGDFLIPAKASSYSEALPDTGVVITVEHPWILIEKGFWQVAMYLVALLVGGLFAANYFDKNLLDPITSWSEYSENLAQKVQTDTNIELQFAERQNEIGTLARGFNVLLKTVRVQTTKAHEEQEQRNAEARQKQVEEVRQREKNLNVIGHEFRSPLQALIALHPSPNDPSRRHIDRMLAALPNLLGGLDSADAINARELTIEELDIAQFLAELVAHTDQIGIANVTYEGPPRGVVCLVDDGAIEDVLSHILTNADRHRLEGSAIRVALDVVDAEVVIEICNEGPTIDENLQDRIFEIGFSTATKSAKGGQGLGLFVARNYLRRMAGELTVRNHENGVAFVIHLPLDKVST